MGADEAKHRKERFLRIRRIKWLMRPLPRRATIHRYPVLRWFTEAARKRSYLWSFRTPEMVTAFYTGWILSLMPLVGIQIPLAFIAALIFRANLPVIVGLQMISNIITFPFIYFVTYQIGIYAMGLAGLETLAAEPVDYDIMEFLHQLTATDAAIAISAMFVGGLFIGSFLGFVCSMTYRLLAWQATRAITRIKSHADTPGAPSSDPSDLTPPPTSTAQETDAKPADKPEPNATNLP